MRRALITAGLALAIALGASAPCAQPVASLEVLSKSGTQHQKLDRIERKVDQLLELHRVVPPKPPVVDPVPPKPAEPTTPAGPNPFIEWCANGGDLVAYAMWRNNGFPLSDAQFEQAYAAGCSRPPAAVPGGGGAGGRAGFHVTVENSPRVNVLQNGQPYTFMLAHPGTVRVFGVSGTQVNRVNGRDVIGGDDIRVAGTTLVLTVEGIGAFGPPEVGVQLVGQ